MNPSFLSRCSAWWPALALALGATVAGCGGGGSSAGVGAGGTGAYASGPITGFGSVIINGVRYDDSSASVSDDDGGTRSRDDLKLGMIAEVVSGPVTTSIGGATATASSVRFRTELKGPVDTAPSGDTVVVFGQTVQVTAATIYEASLAGGLSAVRTGDILEVYATWDAASQRYIASRVEREDGGTSNYKLRGVLANLDTTARTFRIGTQTFSYAGLAAGDVPAGLADGSWVRVRTTTTPSAGRWVVTRLEDGARRPEDGNEVELEGRISAYTSPSSFVLEGVSVNAANARFEDGVAGALALGVRVEVEGTMTGGVLVARKVEFEDDDDDDDRGIELKGSLSSLDTGARTFVLRGVTVHYGPGVVFEDGTEASLADGRRVEVKGARGADGVTVEAASIEFDD